MTYAEKQKIKRIVKRVVFWGAVLFLLLNVSIGSKIEMVRGCISIAFDKWDMMWADKAILYVDGQEYVITDIDLVREIAKDTAVATYYEECECTAGYKNDRWIELYVGDRQIRRMQWLESHDWVRTYDTDAFHWVLFNDTDAGYAELDLELCQKLYQLVKEGPD